jgi:hypothetical protein
MLSTTPRTSIGSSDGSAASAPFIQRPRQTRTRRATGVTRRGQLLSAAAKHNSARKQHEQRCAPARRLDAVYSNVTCEQRRKVARKLGNLSLTLFARDDDSPRGWRGPAARRRLVQVRPAPRSRTLGGAR